MGAGIPKEMEEEFRLIQDELFTIIAKWRTFIDLYGAESHVELLNQTAPLFFSIVQDTFVDDVILSIGRLLDPPKSMGKENLSIAHLIDQIAQAGLDVLHAEALDLYSSIRADAVQLTTIRNKRLAHNDLAERQAGSVSLYMGVSRNFIEEKIQRLCDLMNKIHTSLSDTETYYASAGILTDGSPALLEVLRRAQQLNREGDYD
jgi:hypothetical protein